MNDVFLPLDWIVIIDSSKGKQKNKTIKTKKISRKNNKGKTIVKKKEKTS